MECTGSQHVSRITVIRYTQNQKIGKSNKFKNFGGKGRVIQHYVIKFVSDLQQVGGFLQFPPPIKLTATI
jgi:hypothetical protein